MQFINGLKKVFKEKQLKGIEYLESEFTGLDFVQFVTLLCNDFDRRAIIDILVCYGSKLNSLCTKTEDVVYIHCQQLLSQTYSYDRLVDIFSLYFFYWDFMKECKKLGDTETKLPNQQVTTIGAIIERLCSSTSIKPYEKHILYKILLILNSKGKEKDNQHEYRVFETFMIDALAPDKDKKVLIYSFITVL